MMPRPPISTLWPDTTLFRSRCLQRLHHALGDDRAQAGHLLGAAAQRARLCGLRPLGLGSGFGLGRGGLCLLGALALGGLEAILDRKSTRLNSSHVNILYVVF